MAEAEKQTMEEALRYFATRIPEEAPNTFSGQMCPQLVSCDEKAKTLIFSYETADWMRNPAGQKQNPAISIQLSYPRPALVGHTIYVRATAIHAGKNMAYVGALAWQDDREDKPFATGTGVHYTAAAIDDDPM